MKAGEVKAKLCGRHPADQGEWTILEEWLGIDFLAWSAWGHHERVGYEVKITRGDFRRDILRPGKQALAIAFCDRFFYAVPAGLLKSEEIAFEPSLWDDGDFERERCPAGCRKLRQADRRYEEAPKRGTVEKDKVPVPIVIDLTHGDSYFRPWWEDAELLTDEQRERHRQETINYHVRRYGWASILCRTCGGKGYVKGARVEREAPTLFVPRDCGLVEVGPFGSRVVKKAPKRDARKIHQSEVAKLVRWVSQRPDPRHKRFWGCVGETERAMYPEEAVA